MKHFLIILGISIGLNLPSFSQSNIFNGILVDGYTMNPIANATISIIGGGKDNTTSDGEFQIDLRDHYELDKKLKLFITHSDYGSNIHGYVVESGLPPVVIKVFRNNSIVIAGNVRELGTLGFIQGIKVTPRSNKFIPGFTPPSFLTDESGNFLIHLSEDNFSDETHYFEISFHDPSGRYADLLKTVDISASLEVFMEPIAEAIFSETFQINDFSSIQVPVEKDRLITIKASGNIRVGEWVGAVGPEGKGAGVLNISLGIYSIFPQFNHGALLVKWPNQKAWQYCGVECHFLSTQDGTIELQFEVNDRIKEDNFGFYDVEITVK